MARAIKLRPESRAILESLKTFPRRLIVGVAKALAKRNELTVGYIQEKKLSKRGRRTLGVVSNLLRESASPTPVKIAGSRLTSSLGSNVVYARIHEFGFEGTVSVPSHQRRIPAFVFGRRAKSAGQKRPVRAHTRKLKLTARRMFGSGIEENERKYADDLSDAVLGAFRG